MAGYSGTPLVRKLGIGPGQRVALLDAPLGFEARLEGLPEGVRLARALEGTGPWDVVVAFVGAGAALDAVLPAARAALAYSGGLWVAWPKRSSGVATDLTEDGVRARALAAGLVDNKVCAIDEVWSGLRLVYRLRDRPGGGAVGSGGR